MSAELLTDNERGLIHELGRVWGSLCRIVAAGPTRDADLSEAVVHIHALQQFVMSQAAGRAYPNDFRLLGESFAADAS